MKPGDKVWYFDPMLELIRESDIAAIEKVDEYVFYLVYDYFAAAACPTLTPEPPIITMPVVRISQNRAFPTREALCEHYRKLFE